MATKILMEALSPTMEEGRLVEWKKQEGDPVAIGEILAEVETDKAVMDLVARAGGTLLKQVVTPGSTVPVSALVGVIGEPGEDVGSLVDGPTKGAAPAAVRKEPKPAGDASAAPAPPAQAASEPVTAPRPAPPATVRPLVTQTAAAAAAPSAGPERIKASPLARRMATERGIDLGRVQGSGPEGRIIMRDIEGAAAAAPPAAAAAVPGRRGDGAPYEDVPLTQIRKTIARRLAQSIGPIPTFYLTTEVDMERTWDAREALNDAARRTGGDAAAKVSFNDIIVKATAMALRQHPQCNAWWQDDRIRYWHEIHVSMAVAVEDGLITPVIRHTDLKSLREIATESRDLASRARERRLKPEEYTGGTFSVSNLGMFDIDEFTAVINPPEAGILAIGGIVAKPVAHEGVVALRRRMRLTMSCDHRVIDGATGAAFLRTLKVILENPLAMVW